MAQDFSFSNAEFLGLPPFVPFCTKTCGAFPRIFHSGPKLAMARRVQGSKHTRTCTSLHAHTHPTVSKKATSRKFSADVRGLSCGHPGSKTSGRPLKPWKNKHLDAGVHDPNARTSMTPGGYKRTSGRKSSG